MEPASCILRLRSRRLNWQIGKLGSRAKGSRWKRRKNGSWEDGVFTFETPTGICWNWRRRARGQFTRASGGENHSEKPKQQSERTRFGVGTAAFIQCVGM